MDWIKVTVSEPLEASTIGRKTQTEFRRRVIFRVLTPILVLLISVLLLEVAGSLFGDYVVIARRVKNGAIQRPYFESRQAFLRGPEFQVSFHTNSKGQRCFAVPPNNANQSNDKIVVLGDSFAVGWGVEYRHSFAGRIASAGYPVENLARHGFSPIIYAAQSQSVVTSLGAKVVIIQVFDNDIVDCTRYNALFRVRIGEKLRSWPESIDFSSSWARQVGDSINQSYTRYTWRKVRRFVKSRPIYNSPFSRHLDQAFSVPQQSVVRPIDPRDPGLAIYLNPKAWRTAYSWTLLLLDQCIERLRLLNCRVILCYVPNYQAFSLPEAATTPLRLSTSLSTLCAKRKIPFVNCESEFSKASRPESLYFVTDGHLNRKGHAQLASCLLKILRSH